MIRTYMVTECIKCGKLTPITKYCKECGAIRRILFSEEFEVMICSKCKHKVAKGKFCGFCGNFMGNLE